jgi:hypothetical protein
MGKKKYIVAKSFNSDKEMYKWLGDPSKAKEIKDKYPPPKYTGDVHLISREVRITEN